MLVLETNLPYKEKLSQIIKIHKHSFWKDGNCLKNANMLDSVNAKIIKSTKCTNCLRLKRPPPQAAVAFLKADDFNQTSLIKYLLIYII